MKVEFICQGIEPISVNDAYTKDRVKTAATHEWLYRLKTELLKAPEKIAALRKGFDRTKHYYRIKYVWLIPQTVFFTESGYISRKSNDWSNTPKIPDDLIFVSQLRTDDTYVVHGEVIKLPYSKDFFCLKLVVEIKDLPGLFADYQHEIPEFLR